AARVPDDRRGDRRDRAEARHRGGGGRYYPRYYDGWYGSGWYGGFWSSMLFGYSGYPWAYHAPYYGSRYGYRDAGDDWGALDLDVSPAKTEVYLDGQYLGRVDSFDGFPQYLWLEEGTYDLVLFREGYQTIARQITVLPGVVISVDHNLEPGESVRPESLAAKTHERRDRRLRYDREARERVGEMEEERRDAADAEDDEEAADVRDRAGADDDRRPRERGGEVGRVRLEVEPDDASVYLDGRFLGTGGEVARLHSGLILDRGAHRVSVVRPGYRPRELEFEVREGEELELEVRLEPGN
ncbi:MAG TPA: PEGA domain-containing protein, partial [Thermoanaerobaculia bacterium]|nr:PEGA domain-containing protein [Thermoanaerobaculia bacterium]